MPECNTVKCHEEATTTLKIEHRFVNSLGEEDVIEMVKYYCDEHAEMWLPMDNLEGRSYTVIDDSEVNE